MSDPTTVCPFCKREHDTPELLELQSRLSAALEEREAAGKLAHGMEADVTDLQCDLNDARSRLDSAAELIANAVANHDGGGRCELDAVSAAVWLRDVERQNTK